MSKRIQTRQNILDAATRLFLEHGFGISLDLIAEAAGVTKPTVYSHFESKVGLLESVIDQLAEQRAGVLEKMLRPSPDPQGDLLRFGEKFLQKILSPESRNWQRFAASESRENPEIGKAFFHAGPARVLFALSRYFEQQTEMGRLRVDHTEMAAEQFVASILGMEMIATQIGQPGFGPDHRQERLRRAVENFMACYGHCNENPKGDTTEMYRQENLK